MSKRAALLIAGIITALAVVVVLGVAGLANRSGQVAAAAGIETSPAVVTAGDRVTPSEVAALQAQLADYQAALEQTNTQLQDAYDQIASLQTGGSRREHEEREHFEGLFEPFEHD